MKLVVDVSSIVKTCLYVGKDAEFGRQVVFEGRKVQINSAEYGIDNAINHIVAKLKFLGLAPRDLILVVEGRSSKALRTAMWEGYKGTRKEDAPERLEEFQKARDGFVRTFLDLGAQAVSQPGVEADDVIAYLAKVLPNCVIDSNDGDLAVLVSETAHTINKANELDTNPYGPFPNRFITVYKALVGDDRDNIKGARGFGEKAFLDLYCLWGDEGLEAMEELIRTRTLERLVEDVPQLKALQRIVDDQQGTYLSYDLARLYPDKVNTYRNPLKWQVGMVRPKPAEPDPRLLLWYGRRKLVHAGNYAAALAWIQENAIRASHVALDIETYQPMEADDWLELRKKRASKDEKEERELANGVDVLGQKLVGMSITFGDNDQFTHYFAVRHDESDGFKNLTPAQVLDVVKLIPQEKPIVVHNAAFELSVLAREWANNAAWQENGWHGFLPNVHDTKVLSSYADENRPASLKKLSKAVLEYDQVTYAEVTGGKKMNEISATQAFDYGCDDTVCTAALYNHFKTVVEIEQTWLTYLEVEQMPAYLDALRFNQGTPISMEELLKQEKEDQEAYDRGWQVLQEFLISKGWQGTVCPQVSKPEEITAAAIKDFYSIVTGVAREKDERSETDAFLETKVRTPDKLIRLLEEDERPEVLLLASVLRQALGSGEVSQLNALLSSRFDGTPKFNLDSSPQVVRLLYEVLGLPVRLRNKVTDAQRAEGRTEGNPRGDDLAMQYALMYDVKPGTEAYDVLKSVQAMKVANTRRKMFYTPYRTVCHWTDGLVHSYLNQCAAVTRRYTSSGPNLQQLPKHAKATGEPPKFRRVFVPHHRRAVVISLDFSGQELRIIAERSQDENLLACYVGDNKKDVHTLTAAGILRKKALARRMDQLWTMAGKPGQPDESFAATVLRWKDITYEEFAALDPEVSPDGPWGKLFKSIRALGKKTNFTTEYGAAAPKLAETLLVDEEEAQQYIDAKLAAFPRSEKWKKEVVARLHEVGYTTTMMGARRHLAEGLLSGRGFEIGAAERQGVNFEIQGSAAEQTKLAMARIWKADIMYRYDARFIGPIHDELVFSVCIDDLVPFLREVHAAMVADYAGMRVPIVSSISFGLNFGDQHEVGETVVPDVIVGKIGELFPNEPANAPWRGEVRLAA